MSTSDDHAGRHLLRSFDPLFSSLVTASIFMHIAVAIWLRMMGPAPEPKLEDFEPERVTRIFYEPRFSKPMRAPGAAPSTEKKADPAPKPAARAGQPRRVVEMGLLAAVGRGGSGIADVFQGKGPAEGLDEILKNAQGVDIAGPAVSTERRTGDAADIGDVRIPDLRPMHAPPSRMEPARRAPNVICELPARDTIVHDGPMDPGILQKTIRARMNGIKACYENELKRSPSLKGKITVRFVVGEDGKVQEADVEEDSMGSDAVGRCIVSLVKRIRFPETGASVEASFPFVFLPSE